MTALYIVANDIDIVKCFFDTDVSGMTVAIGEGNNSDVSGKTTADMIKSAAYTTAGWNFETTWYIDEGKDYPRLGISPFEKPAVTLPKYTVEVSSAGNGTATVSLVSAVVGTEITLTATPDTGYRFKEWLSGDVTVAGNKFAMPAKHVTIMAVFEPATTLVLPPNPFSDVKESNWFYKNVLYAYSFKLIDGKTPTEFQPDVNLTYAEAVKLAACMHELYTTGAVTLENGSPWYKTYADYAKINGIISADYAWDEPATRAGCRRYSPTRFLLRHFRR